MKHPAARRIHCSHSAATAAATRMRFGLSRFAERPRGRGSSSATNAAVRPSFGRTLFGKLHERQCGPFPRVTAMRDSAELQAMIQSLAGLVDEAEAGNKNRWKDVWTEIKGIGQAFKDVRFTTPGDRQAAWDRFQAIVASVKASQQKACPCGEPAKPETRTPGGTRGRLASSGSCHRAAAAWKWLRSDRSCFSAMKPTRSLAVIAEHQVNASAAGRSLFLSAVMTTSRQLSMSSVIMPSSLISTW